MSKRWSILAVGAIAVVASAHVGSPNVIFDGNAGPYPVRVVVRPPMVVPGRAEVIVQLRNGVDPTVKHVMIRPVFWRAGVAGAPVGDEAAPVPTARATYSGLLWLMAAGAYSVYVTVQGTRGAGTAVVPVMSFATGRLGFSPGLAILLALLGLVLVAALLTLVYAAVAESQLAPGEPLTPARRRRARIATAVALPAIALILFGGAKWWQSVDAEYQRTLYSTPKPTIEIRSAGGQNVLDMSTLDPTDRISALIPDHGKIMHLFLISRDGAGTFAHLHPTQLDSTNFRLTLPPLPAGAYRLFADVTTENATSLTLTSAVTLPQGMPGAAAGDSDDAWTTSASVPQIAPNAAAALGDGFSLAWTGAADSLRAGETTDLRFTVRDANGPVNRLEPYLGMAAHAVVMRDDGSVFIHLHPMGTISSATQAVFALRDRGDTTRTGHLPSADVTAAQQMADMPLGGTFAIPYEFPKPGRYRIWVQVKPKGRVLTGTFDVVVR
ncbi:MAG TPA: hypothetical protein VN600_07890 [Gemmatimonadaceae bacterium]|nr:hypothetical protein [Gemmatimonadaceae bacterium]